MSSESLPSGVLKVAELLPCPFCGVTPVIERCADSHDRLYGERKWWGIKCRSTLNRGGTCAVEIAPQASIEAATERWNRRACPPPQATGAPVDVERIMALAEKMMRDSWATGDDSAWHPARDELRAALASPEGSPR